MAKVKNPMTVVQSGGNDNVRWDYIRSASYMYGQINSSGAWAGSVTFPDEIYVPKMERCVYANRMFVENVSTSKIILGGFSHSGVNLSEAFRDCGTRRKEVFLEEDIYPKTMQSMFENASFYGGFSGIGRINCSLCTNMSVGSLEYCGHIEFVENTIGVSFSSVLGKNNILDDISLISIANGLNESATSKTLDMNNDVLPRFSSIIGTVALITRQYTNVTDGSVSVDVPTFVSAVSSVIGKYTFTFDGTDWKDSNSNTILLSDYGITLTGTPSATNTITVDLFHLFTQDSSGTTSLEEFITVTKGWTLA